MMCTLILPGSRVGESFVFSSPVPQAAHGNLPQTPQSTDPVGQVPGQGHLKDFEDHSPVYEITYPTNLSTHT